MREGQEEHEILSFPVTYLNFLREWIKLNL